MRLFQFTTFYPEYLKHINGTFVKNEELGFRRHLQKLLDHRFDAVHILSPVYRDSEDAFFTIANDTVLQKQWATEHGFRWKTLQEIVLAQIEEHRAEVIYCLNPIVFNNEFLSRLPGCVKKKICWHAAPGGGDFEDYDLRICNFPPFLDYWKLKGLRSAWFSPSCDPITADFAQAEDRDIDVAFVGSFSEAHPIRARLLTTIAERCENLNLVFHLLHPRWKVLGPGKIFNRIPIPSPYLPKILRGISKGPLFGLDLYSIFARSKIVINAHGTVAEGHRGNMRCFEAIGCGTRMLSDAGVYSEGLVPQFHFETYQGIADAILKIKEILSKWSETRELCRLAVQDFESKFSKEHQWEQFRSLVESI